MKQVTQCTMLGLLMCTACHPMWIIVKAAVVATQFDIHNDPGMIENKLPGPIDFHGYRWYGWKNVCVKHDSAHNNSKMYNLEVFSFKTVEKNSSPSHNFTYCFIECAKNPDCFALNLFKTRVRKVLCDLELGPLQDPNETSYNPDCVVPNGPCRYCWQMRWMTRWDTDEESRVNCNEYWVSFSSRITRPRLCSEYMWNTERFQNPITGQIHQAEAWHEEGDCEFLQYRSDKWCPSCHMHRMDERYKSNLGNIFGTMRRSDTYYYDIYNNVPKYLRELYEVPNEPYYGAYGDFEDIYQLDMWCWEYWEPEEINECTEIRSICKDRNSKTYCVNTIGSYNCLCIDGYITRQTKNGTACSDHNECYEKTHQCIDGRCHNIKGSYWCECDKNRGYIISLDFHTCQSICRHGGTWNPTNKSCACTSLYQGRYCTEDVQECTQQTPCKNKARCIEQSPGYFCACEKGWRGKDCDVEYAIEESGSWIGIVFSVIAGIIGMAAIVTRVCFFIRETKRMKIDRKRFRKEMHDKFIHVPTNVLHGVESKGGHQFSAHTPSVFATALLEAKAGKHEAEITQSEDDNIEYQKDNK